MQETPLSDEQYEQIKQGLRRMATQPQYSSTTPENRIALQWETVFATYKPIPAMSEPQRQQLLSLEMDAHIWAQSFPIRVLTEAKALWYDVVNQWQSLKKQVTDYYHRPHE